MEDEMEDEDIRYGNVHEPFLDGDEDEDDEYEDDEDDEDEGD